MPSTAELENFVDTLVTRSLAPTTLAKYISTWKNFTNFLGSRNLPHFSNVKAGHIALYLGNLANNGLKHSTICSRLSAIEWFLKINGNDDPSRRVLLQRVLKGINNISVSKVKKNLPITKRLLSEIVGIISFATSTVYESVLIKACFLLAYHAALRAGEFCCSGSTKHTIKIENVTLIRDSAETKISFKKDSFKHSKEPALFILPPSGDVVNCPVEALLRYLKVRPSTGGPLFVTREGKPLLRAKIAKILKACIVNCGLEPEFYNTHSFRAGRASDLALSGVPKEVIKYTGRWSSNAFTKYVRFDRFHLPRL